MAKRVRSIEGVGDEELPPTYDDDKHYEVRLSTVVEYPPGSGTLLSPSRDSYIELRGRVVNAISDSVLEAREVVGRKVRDFEEPRAKTNLFSVKSYKKL